MSTKRHPALWPLVTLIAVAGLLALRAVWDPALFPAFWAYAWPAAALSLYGEKRSLYIRGFGALNFGEPVYFAMALEHGPAAGALLAAAVGVVGDALNKKSADVRVFNLGWALLTFSAVGGVARRLNYPGLTRPEALPAFLLCVAVYLLVAGGLQALAQVVMENMPLRQTVGQQVTLMGYNGLAVICLGGVLAVLLAREAWLLLLMAFPVEVLSALVERERLQKQLIATQRALVESEKKAAIGLLGAGVAHELNTPLAAILMNCHMLRLGLQPEEQDKCVGIVEKAATRAKDIVEALLTYARPPGGEGAGDVARALADTVMLLGFPVELPEGSFPAVKLPTGDLMRVFTNLLQNAHLAGATRITVHVDGTVVRVEDNGSGIPEEVRDRIFDPFFTTREPGQGTGLGLSMSRSLVEQAGGTLVLESTGSTGTVFRIEFDGTVLE